MAATEELQTVEEIEAEILAILEDCQRRGLSKEEMREIFSPLGLPEFKDTTRLKRTKGTHHHGDKTKKRRTSGSNTTSVASWKRTLLYVTMVIATCAFTVHFYEEELKSLRFHVLAITRIALIKVKFAS